MSKKIITIGRQFGSGGHEIGERLAKKLNVPFYDRELVEKAAEELNLNVDAIENYDEKAVHHFVMNSFGSFTTDRVYNVEDYNRPISDQVYTKQAAIIKELANQGPCVIVGRCADYILKDRDDVLSVFICADDDYRIKRLREVRGYVPDLARQKMKDMDKKRRKYYNKYVGDGWDSRETHHMVLNVSLLGADYIVDMLAKMTEI